MNKLPPYKGEYPELQEAAEWLVRRLVEEADGRLVSRQALAVMRVLVDEMGRLNREVEELRRAFLRPSRGLRQPPEQGGVA